MTRVAAPSKSFAVNPSRYCDHGRDAGAKLVDRLLRVRVFRRLFAREAGGGELRGVARDLNLPSERELVGREAHPE